MRIFGVNAISALVLLSLLLDFGDANIFENGKPAVDERGPVQIGDHHPIRISSIVEESDIQPTTSADGKGSVYTIKHDGASYIAVHFSNMDLPPSCYMETSDALGGQATILLGRGRQNLGSFWAQHVTGDTMIINVQCDGNEQDASFTIDDYVSGFPNLRAEIPEWFPQRRNLRHQEHAQMSDAVDVNPFVDSRALSICGTDDKKNAVCYKKSHPTEYTQAKAVARLFINGSGGCTGWLVGPYNKLLTNEHCIKSLSDVLNTDFEFMGEESTCTSTTGNCWMCQRGTIFDGTALLVVNASEDFALVQIASNPAGTYGYLTLDNRTPTVGEKIYIPQHPGGRAKEIGLVDSSAKSTFCEVMSVTASSCTGGSAYKDFSYSCDTEGGSSGSPVLSSTNHMVIALHHCGGGCNGNLGVPVKQFYHKVINYVNSGIAPTQAPLAPTQAPLVLSAPALLVPKAPALVLVPTPAPLVRSAPALVPKAPALVLVPTAPVGLPP